MWCDGYCSFGECCVGYMSLERFDHGGLVPVSACSDLGMNLTSCGHSHFYAPKRDLGLVLFWVHYYSES